MEAEGVGVRVGETAATVEAEGARFFWRFAVTHEHAHVRIGDHVQCLRDPQETDSNDRLPPVRHPRVLERA